MSDDFQEKHDQEQLRKIFLSCEQASYELLKSIETTEKKMTIINEQILVMKQILLREKTAYEYRGDC